MFYYLLYNSSFSFIVDNRLFSTVLYGSILYILTHAILNYCKVEILEIINNYYWFIFILDIISLAYGVYQNDSTLSQHSTTSSPNLDVSFNLLKNQINTIGSYFNKKNDITISANTPVPIPTPRQPLRIPTRDATHTELNTATNCGLTSSSTQLSRVSQYQMNHSNQPPQQYSNTTINNSNTSTSGFSTPITALREQPPPSRNTQVSHIPSPIITSSDIAFGNNEFGDGMNESIAGSDVGSIMDLDDFEKSL